MASKQVAAMQLCLMHYPLKDDLTVPLLPRPNDSQSRILEALGVFPRQPRNPPVRQKLILLVQPVSHLSAVSYPHNPAFILREDPPEAARPSTLPPEFWTP